MLGVISSDPFGKKIEGKKYKEKKQMVEVCIERRSGKIDQNLNFVKS